MKSKLIYFILFIVLVSLVYSESSGSASVTLTVVNISEDEEYNQLRESVKTIEDLLIEQKEGMEKALEKVPVGVAGGGGGGAAYQEEMVTSDEHTKEGKRLDMDYLFSAEGKNNRRTIMIIIVLGVVYYLWKKRKGEVEIGASLTIPGKEVPLEKEIKEYWDKKGLPYKEDTLSSIMKLDKGTKEALRHKMKEEESVEYKPTKPKKPEPINEELFYKEM